MSKYSIRGLCIYNTTNKKINITISQPSKIKPLAPGEIPPITRPVIEIGTQPNTFTQGYNLEWGDKFFEGVELSFEATLFPSLNTENVILAGGANYSSDGTSYILKLSEENNKLILSVYDTAKEKIVLLNRSGTSTIYELYKVGFGLGDKTNDKNAFNGNYISATNHKTLGCIAEFDLKSLNLDDLELVTVKCNVISGSDCMASRPVLYSSTSKEMIGFIEKGTIFETWLVTMSADEAIAKDKEFQNYNLFGAMSASPCS